MTDHLATARRMLQLCQGRHNYVAISNGNGGFQPEKLTAPLTPERLAAEHLAEKTPLGTYCLQEDERTSFVCADFDNKPGCPDPEWQNKAERLYFELAALGLNPVVEISQSGCAAHVWVFFASPITAALARGLMFQVAARLCIRLGEVYPRQDHFTPVTPLEAAEGKEPIGNLIRYIGWHKSAIADVENDWAAIPLVKALEEIRQNDADEVRDLAARLGVDVRRLARVRKSLPAPVVKFNVDTEPPTEKFSALVANDEKFQQSWDKQRADLKDKTGSAYEMSLASLAAHAGWTDQEVCDLLSAWHRKHGTRFNERRIRYTIGKARASVIIAKEQEGISNCKTIEVEVEDVNGEKKKEKKTVPATMREILADLWQRTDDWPRRVGTALFVHDENQIGWLEHTASVFGWAASTMHRVMWFDRPGCVTKPEFHRELSRVAISYRAVEILPHEPKIPEHYYACEFPAPGDGSALRELLDRFRPETTIDRDLIQSAIVTPFWGGPPGARPAFVVTTDYGRGVGKSKAVEIIVRLAGGFVDISAQEEISILKQRLLSPDALTLRAAVIDNIKTMKFSWAELEALITSAAISGKRLYVGNATRPNTLTWFCTLNGVSLSTDMAQRSVIIKLAKGANAPTWYEDTTRFVDEPEPSEARRVIEERQIQADAEADENQLLEEFFADQLKRFRYDPETDAVRIPIATAAKWYGWATNETTRSVTAISRRLKQMADEGQLKRLSPDPSRNFGRCFIWTGARWTKGNIRNDLREQIAGVLQTAPDEPLWDS